MNRNCSFFKSCSCTMDCSNCHTMVLINNKKPQSMEEVKELMRINCERKYNYRERLDLREMFWLLVLVSFAALSFVWSL